MRIPSALFAATAVLTLAACNNNATPAPEASSTGAATTQANGGELQDAQMLVSEATQELQKMKSDPGVAKLLQQAKGVYLVPEFGRGALIVGGRGGAGLVVAKTSATTGTPGAASATPASTTAGMWSPPAFYNFGGASIGAQAGGSGGQIAFVLMSKNAVDAFMSGNKITLNADAGLSIIDYSANAQASWGKADIVMWSDTQGLYGGAQISVTDLNWDDGKNQAFYGPGVQPQQVLTGQATTTQDISGLKQALP